MTIKLSKFGEILTSRPAGHEAHLAARSYLFSHKPDRITINFDGVKVMTPSWLDEFVSPLITEYGKEKIVFDKSDNASVIASLSMLSI